jgi:hypothetical protein
MMPLVCACFWPPWALCSSSAVAPRVSKLLIDDQIEILGQLNQLVRDTSHFRETAQPATRVEAALKKARSLAFCEPWAFN